LIYMFKDKKESAEARAINELRKKIPDLRKWMLALNADCGSDREDLLLMD
jgi:hypothetical protein